MERELGNPKYIFCLFTMEGHRTWRMMQGVSVEQIEHQLKRDLGKNKVTKKRFYEIDRLTGEISEF